MYINSMCFHALDMLTHVFTHAVCLNVLHIHEVYYTCFCTMTFSLITCNTQSRCVYLKYWIFFTLPVSNSATKRLSLESTLNSLGRFKSQLWM